MSYTYTVSGQRFLRKYTAAATSPVYAAAIDAQQIADTLCDVKWEKVSAATAGFTSHDAESLDENVAARDTFDAALFCAGHEHGKHTAYANAACYRLTLPDSAVGVTLESLAVKAASDPYNVAGLRLAILTNSTGVIPTDCATCRNGDAHVEGAVPRSTRTVGTTTYWDATADTVTITPAGGLTLQKYLLVFVVLENYATSRNNWLEGSGYIQNALTLTTAAEVTGWNDVAAEGNALRVVKDGLLPLRTAGDALGTRYVAVMANGNPILTLSGRQFAGAAVTDAAQTAIGLARLYHDFLAGDGEVPVAEPGAAAHGAKFRLRRTTKAMTSEALDANAALSIWEIESSVLVVPFVLPTGFTPSRLKLDFAPMSLTEGTCYNVWLAADYVRAADVTLLKSPDLYDARGEIIGWRRAGTVSSSAALDLTPSEAASRYLTVAVSAYLPPDAVSLSSTEWQGTPETETIPDITII